MRKRANLVESQSWAGAAGFSPEEVNAAGVFEDVRMATMPLFLNHPQ